MFHSNVDVLMREYSYLFFNIENAVAYKELNFFLSIFAANKAVDTLLDSQWATGKDVLFTDRQSVVNFCNKWVFFFFLMIWHKEMETLLMVNKTPYLEIMLLRGMLQFPSNMPKWNATVWRLSAHVGSCL